MENLSRRSRRGQGSAESRGESSGHLLSAREYRRGPHHPSPVPGNVSGWRQRSGQRFQTRDVSPGAVGLSVSGKVGSNADDSFLPEGLKEFSIAFGKITLAVKVEGAAPDRGSRFGAEDVPSETAAAQFQILLTVNHVSHCSERRSSPMRSASLLRSCWVNAR